MDLPLRIIIALCLIGGIVAIAVPAAIVTLKRRRREKLRRRGIKTHEHGRARG